MASAFKVGDLVWAKMKGFPPWPGLVSDPPDKKKINDKKPKYFIFFFGSENFAWVTFDNMFLYLEKREEYVAMLRPTHSFQEAVDAIDDYVREHGGFIPETPKKPSSPSKQSDNEEERMGSGRRSRKRHSTAVVQTPLKSKADNKAKSAKKDTATKKKEEKIKSVEKKEVKEKVKSDVGKKEESEKLKKEGKSKDELVELKLKKLNNDDDDDDDDGVELKSKRISRKRMDDVDDEEEYGMDGVVEGGHEAGSSDGLSSDSAKPKEVRLGDEVGNEEEEEKDVDDLAVEKMLVGEEGVEVGGEKEGDELNKKDDDKQEENKKEENKNEENKKEENKKEENKKEANKKEENKKEEKVNNVVKRDKSIGKGDQKDNKKLSKPKDEVVRKENGMLAGKRKSTSLDKNVDSGKKKAFLPDVLSSTTTDPTSSTTTTSKLNKKFSSIVPTKKKIGFIGCGSVGRRLVDCLLASKHHVSLWNRSINKCKELIKKGAIKCSSPSDVVKKSDVIITCLSDAVAFKDVVYGSNGVLQSMKEGKGLVNLTTVDVETTLDACEAVKSRGGVYLEAAMLGSVEDAGIGEMLVLVSGDQTLYGQCSSLFMAISKNIFNLVDMGTATKMQVVFNSLYGTTIAGLAEGLSLASKVGIDPAEVLEVVSHTSVVSPLIRSKGEAMVKNNLDKVDIKLDTLQRDIRLAINMSEEVDQPLHVGSVVNELFKKAKAKGYGDHDVAAVYRATDL